MANIKKGDKVMITDLEGIEFGNEAWREHDITEVTHIDSDGDAWLAVTFFTDCDEYEEHDGRLSFLVTRNEFPCLAKLLPVNAADTPLNAAEKTLKVGQRVKIVNDGGYALRKEMLTGTVVEPRKGRYRGEHHVAIDNYFGMDAEDSVLSFKRHELEAMTEYGN